MGTEVANPSYLPTTVEHMARKQLAQTAAEKAAAAADPFQPAPSPTTTTGYGRLNTTQKYAKFATRTEEWEARNKTRMDALHEALAEKDKRRKGGPKK